MAGTSLPLRNVTRYTLDELLHSSAKTTVWMEAHAILNASELGFLRIDEIVDRIKVFFPKRRETAVENTLGTNMSHSPDFFLIPSAEKQRKGLWGLTGTTKGVPHAQPKSKAKSPKKPKNSLKGSQENVAIKKPSPVATKPYARPPHPVYYHQVWEPALVASPPPLVLADRLPIQTIPVSPTPMEPEVPRTPMEECWVKYFNLPAEDAPPTPFAVDSANRPEPIPYFNFNPSDDQYGYATQFDLLPSSSEEMGIDFRPPPLSLKNKPTFLRSESSLSGALRVLPYPFPFMSNASLT